MRSFPERRTTHVLFYTSITSGDTSTRASAAAQATASRTVVAYSGLEHRHICAPDPELLTGTARALRRSRDAADGSGSLDAGLPSRWRAPCRPGESQKLPQGRDFPSSAPPDVGQWLAHQ